LLCLVLEEFKDNQTKSLLNPIKEFLQFLDIQNIFNSTSEWDNDDLRFNFQRENKPLYLGLPINYAGR
jgi:hypothetical protein